MKQSLHFRFVAVCLAWLSQFVSSGVAASGIAGAPFGGELGSVVTANPTAIYYNPGALGFSGTQLMVDAMLVMRSTSWSHAQGQGDVPEPAGFEGANYGSARLFITGFGPQMAASFRLGDHLVIGGGAYIPWGGGTFTYPRNARFANTMYPGAADGVARWHGYSGGLMFFYGSAGAAVRFGTLSVGATFNLIYCSFSGGRALTVAGNNDITREQRGSFESREFAGSFGLGAMWEALPEQLWLGASYQAQPGLGELSMEGTFTVDATVNVMDQTRVQDITMHLAMPDIIRAGVRFKASPSLEIRLDASYTRWSLNQTQCLGLRDQPCTVRTDGGPAPGSGVIRVLRRNWNNTLGVHIGVSYWPLPSFELFGGLGYEPTAVPDATLDPLTADADNFTVALGGRVRVLDTWFIALSYNHKQFLPRDITGKSDLANPAIAPASRGVDGGGKYESFFASVHLNLAKTF